MSEAEPSLEIAKQRQAAELQALLDDYKHERVVVPGGTCTGKSTLIEHLHGARDMDRLVFPLLRPTTSTKRPERPKLGLR